MTEPAETSAAEVFARWGGHAPFNGDVEEAIRFGDREATLALLRARRLPAQRAKSGVPTEWQLENARTASLTAHLATCGMRVQMTAAPVVGASDGTGSAQGPRGAAVSGDAGDAENNATGKGAQAEGSADSRGKAKGKGRAKPAARVAAAEPWYLPTHTRTRAHARTHTHRYLPEKDRVVEAMRTTIERAQWAEATASVAAAMMQMLLLSLLFLL